MITDRLHFVVTEANTDRLLSADLITKQNQVKASLTAPSHMTLVLDQGQSVDSAEGINWRSWGQWVYCEIEYDGVSEVFCYGIVTDVQIDPQNGDLTLEVTGPIGYAKGIPWLENYNPPAPTILAVVQRVWAHLESYDNAMLGIDIVDTPGAWTGDHGGIEGNGPRLLPGFGFDGNALSFDFYAMFVRPGDFLDCGDTISGLARDMPFDMFEEATGSGGSYAKTIRLAYPMGGVKHQDLLFEIGDNVLSATLADEEEIGPASDVIIRGWLPGRITDAKVTDEDMSWGRDETRFRRVVMEEAVHIDSGERAAAYAKRRLQKRHIPKYFNKIIIDPNHPNAELGSFKVGDSIRIVAANFPWKGELDDYHRILSITYGESPGGQQSGGGTPNGMAELETKAEGAFNYDPIEYDPDYEAQPVMDYNRIQNGYFGHSMAGWRSLQGQWFRVASVTYSDDYDTWAGSARVDCDDGGERLRSHACWCLPGEELILCAAVKWADVEGSGAFELWAYPSLDSVYLRDDAGQVAHFVVGSVNATGTAGWHMLKMNWTVPDEVNEIALEFHVTSAVSHGKTWWTFARVYPTVVPAQTPPGSLDDNALAETTS
jgi:hypothetical protein